MYSPFYNAAAPPPYRNALPHGLDEDDECETPEALSLLVHQSSSVHNMSPKMSDIYAVMNPSRGVNSLFDMQFEEADWDEDVIGLPKSTRSPFRDSSDVRPPSRTLESGEFFLFDGASTPSADRATPAFPEIPQKGPTDTTNRAKSEDQWNRVSMDDLTELIGYGMAADGLWEPPVAAAAAGANVNSNPTVRSVPEKAPRPPSCPSTASTARNCVRPSPTPAVALSSSSARQGILTGTSTFYLPKAQRIRQLTIVRRSVTFAAAS